MHALLLLALLAVCTAMPSYIAVPADQIAFVDLSALRVRRVPRQTLTPPPPPSQQPLYRDYREYAPVQELAPLQEYPVQEYPVQYQQQRRVPRQTLAPPPPPALPLYREYAPVQELAPVQEYPVQYRQQPIALAPEPEAPARIVQIQAPAQPDVAGAASALAERPPDFGEYVDFGAHTGDNGAFGWYADYPINGHEDSSYRK